MRKATEHSIWIVVAIVICLITALIITVMMNKTARQATDSTEDPIIKGGETLKTEMCKRACDSCLRVHDGCPDWDTGEGTAGEGCREELGIDCPYE